VPTAAEFFVAIVLCLVATLAQAAGFRFIGVPADTAGPALKGAMWYPCAEPPGEIDLGGLVLPGAKDCPISRDKLPLVVVSHGDGGALWNHHDTAEMLAGAGFIVAAIRHPGDNVLDMSRSVDLSMMVERPADIKRLIDFMLGASPAASKIDPERIGVFGYSAGGYTALVLIGGLRFAYPPYALPALRHSRRQGCVAAGLFLERVKYNLAFLAAKAQVAEWALADAGRQFETIDQCRRGKDAVAGLATKFLDAGGGINCIAEKDDFLLDGAHFARHHRTAVQAGSAMHGRTEVAQIDGAQLCQPVESIETSAHAVRFGDAVRQSPSRDQLIADVSVDFAVAATIGSVISTTNRLTSR
jgi:hypothetical protein